MVEVEVVLVPIEGPELVLVGTHDAVTFLTGPVPGGTSADVGVPGGTLTLKVNICPVSSVTVTVHWSAEAVGTRAMPAHAPEIATASAVRRQRHRFVRCPTGFSWARGVCPAVTPAPPPGPLAYPAGRKQND